MESPACRDSRPLGAPGCRDPYIWCCDLHAATTHRHRGGCAARVAGRGRGIRSARAVDARSGVSRGRHSRVRSSVDPRIVSSHPGCSPRAQSGGRWRSSEGRRSVALQRQGGPMTEFVTSADGTRIAFDREGAGPPVILIGGAMQFRAFDPATVEMASLLAGHGFTVVNYDRRGRGESPADAPITLDQTIDDLRALTELLTEGADDAVALFGNSS